MSEMKVAIVTGASGGIGSSIALRLAKEQYRVVVHYGGNEAAANALVKTIESHGGEAFAYAADIADVASSEALVKETLHRYGRVDVLINNAGVTRDQLFIRMSVEDFNHVIDTNLKGTFNMIKHVSRSMLKQRFGRIVNITSVVGEIGNAGQANYAASKAGIRGLTQSLAKEFGKKNVTVNAVAPGFIETAMTASLPAEVQEAYLAQIPLGRYGSPDDVAGVVAFLIGQDGDYITGQTIQVNGGMV